MAEVYQIITSTRRDVSFQSLFVILASLLFVAAASPAFQTLI